MSLPLGEPVDVRDALRPQHTVLRGQSATICGLNAAIHADDLFEALEESDHLWTYLSSGPFADRTTFRRYVADNAASDDPLFFAIVDNASDQAIGQAALLRIEPGHRVIEVGHILYSPRLQRTRAATEAMYLLARHVFEDLGYRRYEWKCNALNAGSRSAALRLGFTFEGVFRQHMIAKGRNRDSAWFSMLDTEWPRRKQEFVRWLSPENFDPSGRQLSRLCHSTAPDGPFGRSLTIIVAQGPE